MSFKHNFSHHNRPHTQFYQPKYGSQTCFTMLKHNLVDHLTTNTGNNIIYTEENDFNVAWTVQKDLVRVIIIIYSSFYIKVHKLKD